MGSSKSKENENSTKTVTGVEIANSFGGAEFFPNLYESHTKHIGEEKRIINEKKNRFEQIKYPQKDDRVNIEFKFKNVKI